MSYPPSLYKTAPTIDPYLRAFATVAHDHMELHEGDSFVVSTVQTLTASSTFYIQLTTANSDQRVHLLPILGVSGNGVTVTLFEAPTTSSGTPMTAVNRNRNSSNVTSVTAVHTPTVTGDGTQLITMRLSATNQSAPPPLRSEDEFVLKPNTKYLLKIVVDSGQSANLSAVLNWYETEKVLGE